MLPVFAWVGNLLAWARHLPRPAPSGAAAPAPARPRRRPTLAQSARPDAVLPDFVAQDAVARKYRDLLGPLDWEHFPERSTNRPWPGLTPAPRASYVAAYLVKLNEGLRSLGHLSASKAATRSAPSAPTACPFAQLTWRCHSSSLSPTAPAPWSSTNAAATSVPCATPSRRPTPHAPSTMSAGPKAAAPSRCPRAQAPASAIN